MVRSVGGKCRVITEEFDPSFGRPKVTYATFTDFKQFYCNRNVEIPGPKGPQQVPLGVWWTHHPDRRQYETVVFAPGSEAPGAYNLWRGFAYDALPGRSCERFLHHVRENLCAGVAEHYDYVLGWMASAVQRPASPGHVAIVMRGRQGTGKGFVAKTFGRLFGKRKNSGPQVT